ncbi:MAG: serine/threonine-protein kinase [Pseudomonadota bacterium]|nr:serine/threonine-protein kinase [Pseudomonadota bacterium]
MMALDRSRWQQLSAALDALLDLPPSQRAARLAEIAGQDAAFAEALRGLLAQEDSHDSLLDSPLLTAPPGPREGEHIGPYRLEKLLGEGGMGQVWLAERADGLYQRHVALKLLRPGLADPNLRLRFTRERQILARLAHPHIARLLDAGISAEGQPYLALEKVEGEGLLEYCRKRGVGLRQRLQIFCQVCAAVSHAHANLVVHRDLKPSNILVTEAGEVRLLDFGIAKLLDGNESDPPEATHTGVRSFTLHYAAPEQIRGSAITTQTDVYSLGVVLYELLTGEKPYRLKRESHAQWEEAILAGEPLRPSVTVLRGGNDEAVPGVERRRWARMLAGDIDNIVLKALAKQPGERYPSAEALSLDIQRHLDGLPVLARRQSLGYRLRKFINRQRWAILLTALVLASLLSLLLLIWSQRQQAVRETARAQALQDFVIALFDNAGASGAGLPLDVESLLDAGEARGERELARQPRAHAELLGVMARIRIALGQYEEARALLMRQAGLLDSMPDTPKALQLDASTQRGRLQRLQGDAAGCIATLQPLQGEARSAQAQLPALAADYYSQLARCQRSMGERSTARRLFEQSLSLRRSVLADDVGVVENLTDIAALSVDARDYPQALRGFQHALAQLRQIAGTRHRLAIDILRSIATTQQQMGQNAAAARSYGEALQLSEELLGAAHPGTIGLRRQEASLLLALGQLQQADEKLRLNHQLIAQRFAANSAEAAASWDALGQSAHARGELDAAHQYYLRAQRLLRELKLGTALADTLQRDAQALLEAGRSEASLKNLQQAARLRDTPTAENLILQAQAWMQLARFADAAELLAQAGILEKDSAQTLIAKARLHALDPDAHEAARRQSEADLQALLKREVKDEKALQQHWQAQAALAQLRCLDDPQAGLAAYQALLETLAELRPQGGSLIRQIGADKAACMAH